MNSDILIIKSNLYLSDRQFNNLREYIERSKSKGVVLLPYYCDAIIVPSDTDVKIESIQDGGNEQ